MSYDLDKDSETYVNLKSKHFMLDSSEYLAHTIDLLATKYRSKKGYLKDFTCLHMVVLTLRCNHNCKYCHASSQDARASVWDMDIKTAIKVVDMIFQCPSPSIKIEFQGGEPLLNFPVIVKIVEYAKRVNRRFKKNVSFVLCTNLSLMTKKILFFLKKHDVEVSTSLDGPKEMHDSNRVLRDGGSSHGLFVRNLEMTKSLLGENSTGALLTVTKTNIDHLRKVIDEYVRLGFTNIFLRSLNPYGYAQKKTGERLQYSIDDYIEAYKDALQYIIELNIKGQHFSESFSTILLTRILTPFATGFVDLQSPTGAGILGAIYNHDGGVYPSDEARMLAAMGDNHFCLGNVQENTYQEIFLNPKLKKIVTASCVETIPGCHSCVYQSYCGSDPIRSYSQQNDRSYIGHMPTSEFCKKHKAVLSHLFSLIRKSNDEVIDVFWSWITNGLTRK
jgi:His-Xaa-Ser system radical SAM maturase HxsB